MSGSASPKAKKKTDAASYDKLTDEEKVKVWRIRECMRATGCTLDAATAFAEGPGDLHRLASHIEEGCAPEVALRIES